MDYKVSEFTEDKKPARDNRIFRFLGSREPLLADDGIYYNYKSIDTLLKEVDEPGIIVFDGLERRRALGSDRLLNSINRLRNSPVFYAAPIFITSSVGKLDAFTDGVYSNTEQILLNGSPILSSLKTVSVSHNAANNDLRLLTFLYARKDSQLLTPLSFVRYKYIYEYPPAYMISGFAGGGSYSGFHSGDDVNLSIENTSTAYWINTLYAQGFLAQKGLVDRIRSCPYCHASIFNYVDYCPPCGSINFEKKKMIHCFTCGNIAPQDDFRSGMALRCPRCDTVLRHIGADYDRPLESYSCNNCGEKFIEPDIKAVCINCGKSTAPDELNILHLRSFGLTTKGERAVQSGVMDLEISLFDGNNNVIPAYFYQVLKWLMLMKTRYTEEDFSLICIKIVEKQSVTGNVSSVQLNSVVDEFSIRIKELVRSTDITTSTGNNTFWLLCPRTPYQGGEILLSKIQNINSMISRKISDYIQIQVKCFDIPADYKVDDEAAVETMIRNYEAEFSDK